MMCKGWDNGVVAEFLFLVLVDSGEVLLRFGSGSKFALKEKFVQIYEQFFKVGVFSFFFLWKFFFFVTFFFHLLRATIPRRASRASGTNCSSSKLITPSC